MGKIKKTLLKIVVSAGLFFILFTRTNIQEVGGNISLLNIWYIPVILSLVVANYLVSAIRWKKLLIFENSSKVSVIYLAKLYFVGSFFNNFMPTSIGGDVYKMFKLGKKINSAAHAFSATFMERFTGIIALVLISYFGLIQTLDYWLALFPSFITESAFLVFLTEFLLFAGFWIASALGFFSLKIIGKRVEKVNKIYLSLMEYKGCNKVLAWAFSTSFIVQLLAIFTQYLVFYAMGTTLPIFYSLFVFPVITLASFFIPSLNGLGVQDVLYIQLLAGVGVPAGTALAGSIIYHLIRLAISLFGGIIYAFGNND